MQDVLNEIQEAVGLLKLDDGVQVIDHRVLHPSLGRKISNPNRKVTVRRNVGAICYDCRFSCWRENTGDLSGTSGPWASAG